MTIYELVGGAMLHARLASRLDLAIDAPVALRHGGGAGLRKYSRRYRAQDGEVAPIHAPPGRQLHRLGVHQHRWSREDAFAPLVAGELKLRLRHSLEHLLGALHGERRE